VDTAAGGEAVAFRDVGEDLEQVRRDLQFAGLEPFEGQDLTVTVSGDAPVASDTSDEPPATNEPTDDPADEPTLAGLFSLRNLVLAVAVGLLVWHLS
jgi:hypothetical protein